MPRESERKPRPPGENLRLTLSLDGDGAVHVVECSHEEFVVTPVELAKLLTGLLAAFVSTRDEEEEVRVNLN